MGFLQLRFAHGEYVRNQYTVANLCLHLKHDPNEINEPDTYISCVTFIECIYYAHHLKR